MISGIVTAQAALLQKGGECGVMAVPSHHTPQFPRKLSSYAEYLIIGY
jgi:hypothetical protein